MNTIKALFISALSVFIFSDSNAQNGVAEPASFKLKNGMNITASENSNSENTFSTFTLDAKAFKTKKDGVVELLTTIFNEGADKQKNIAFNDQSAKISTSVNELTKDLASLSASIQNIQINENTLNAAKAKLINSLKNQLYEYDQTAAENSLNKLSLADVQDFYNEITPEKIYLTVVGAIKVADAKNAAKKAFGSWKPEQKSNGNSIAK